jgi:hypothetical protein
MCLITKNYLEKMKKLLHDAVRLQLGYVCLMWLQTGENTVDCLISYSVVATTDVPRL